MRNLEIEWSPRKSEEMVKYNRGYSANFLLAYEHSSFDFCLAEGRILHFPLTYLWHSDRLVLKFTNIDSSKGTASEEMTSFAMYGRSHAPFLWKNSSIMCPTIGFHLPFRNLMFLPSQLPLGLILRTFCHVCFLHLSITLFFTKAKNGLVHFVKLCK